MVIFNSYVKLPEGNPCFLQNPQIQIEIGSSITANGFSVLTNMDYDMVQ
jgi:hypothetical protein